VHLQVVADCGVGPVAHSHRLSAYSQSSAGELHALPWIGRPGAGHFAAGAAEHSEPPSGGMICQEGLTGGPGWKGGEGNGRAHAARVSQATMLLEPYSQKATPPVQPASAGGTISGQVQS
jgi:hypothetical protein